MLDNDKTRLHFLMLGVCKRSASLVGKYCLNLSQLCLPTYSIATFSGEEELGTHNLHLITYILQVVLLTASFQYLLNALSYFHHLHSAQAIKP